MLSHDDMVINILAFYADATADERANGFAWYAEAKAHAATLAHVGGVPVEVAAAVIAALSPQTGWEHNKRWATEVVQAYALGAPLPSRGLGNNLRRAARALSGDLSDIKRESGTLKVNRFWRSILGERGVATIDRHALRVALGDANAEVPSLTDKRYLAVEAAYVAAGRELRKGARHVQAVTWMVCRRQRGLSAAAG